MTPCSFTVSKCLYTPIALHRLSFQLDSGHGGQTKDRDGDEADGQDEGSLILSVDTCKLILFCISVIYPVPTRHAPVSVQY